MVAIFVKLVICGAGGGIADDAWERGTGAIYMRLNNSLKNSLENFDCIFNLFSLPLFDI